MATVAGIAAPIVQGEANAAAAETNAEMARQSIINSLQNYQQNEKITNMNVKHFRKESNAEIGQLRQQNAQILAANRAVAGSDGIDFSGSDILFQMEQAENAEFQALEFQRQKRYEERVIKYEGDLKSYEYFMSAREAEMQRRNYKMQAKYARKGAAWGAIGGGLSGLGTDISTGLSVVKSAASLLA